MKRMNFLILPFGSLGSFHSNVRKSELLFITFKLISLTEGILSKVVAFNIEEFVQPPPVHALRISEYSVPAFKLSSTLKKLNKIFFSNITVNSKTLSLHRL